MSESHGDALYASLKGELDSRLRTYTETAREFLADALARAVVPHIEAAYQRGLTAGREQANYPTRRKKKEKPRWYHLPPQTDAPSAEPPSRA